MGSCACGDARCIDNGANLCIWVYIVEKPCWNLAFVDITIHVCLFILVLTTSVSSFIQPCRLVIKQRLQNSILNHSPISYTNYQLHKVTLYIQNYIGQFQLYVCLNSLYGCVICFIVLFVIRWLGMQRYQES